MPGRPQMVLRDPAELNRLMAKGGFNTAVALAEASGVNRQTIGWLRAGERNSTSKASAKALAKTLGVPLDHLFKPWTRDDSSPPDEEPLALTIKQVMTAIGVSETHVYRLIAAGELDTTDVSVPGSSKSKARVPRDSLAAYIRRRTSNAKKQRALA